MSCISVVLPCESRLTEENCSGLFSEVSDFLASEIAGDVLTVARLSGKHHYHSMDYSSCDEACVGELQQRDLG